MSVIMFDYKDSRSLSNAELFFKRLDVLVGGLDPDIKRLLIACNLKSYASIAFLPSENIFFEWIEGCIRKFEAESDEARYIESLIKQGDVDYTLQDFEIYNSLRSCCPLRYSLQAIYKIVKEMNPGEFVKLA